jgi:CheY-like chemotaxis protein
MSSELEILVVDDEPMIASMLTNVLVGEGFCVTCVNSAAEAMERIGSDVHHFGLIVADVHLGDGADGLEVAAALAQSNAAVGAIFMTGDLPRRYEHRAPAGAIFLEKPFLPFQLVEAVRRLRLPEAA